MVSVAVGVSTFGRTDLIFVDPGVKINGAYYGEGLPAEKLLPVMRETCSAISSLPCSFRHRARINLLHERDMLGSFHQSSHLNPNHYKIWGEMQQKVYEMNVHDVDELKQPCLTQTEHFENILSI